MAIRFLYSAFFTSSGSLKNHFIQITEASLRQFFEALAMITFYDSSCISTPLSSSWNLLVR